jgi:hypothetical protein
MERHASSVSALFAGHVTGAATSMSSACTPVPLVVTVTLPDASMVSRSPALRTALAAVGAQTPPEQLTFWVVSEEIVNAACAADPDTNIAATTAAQVATLRRAPAVHLCSITTFPSFALETA